MKNHRKWVQIAILAIVVLLGGWTVATNWSSGEVKAPELGDPALEFKLLGLDGEVHRLSEYKGKTVVLNFWGTYCPPCKDEMPAMQNQYEKWKDAGVTFIGVNMGESEVTARSFVEQVGVTFPILLDKTEEVRKSYRVIQFPTTFFLDPEGKVRHIKIGEMDEPFMERTLSAITGGMPVD